MSFVITKVLMYLILPPASFLILMGVGFFIMKKHPHCGRAFAGAGFFLLYLMSTGYVADRLIKPLEEEYRPFTVSAVKLDAVVVLTAGAKDLSWMDVKSAPSEASLERLVTGIRFSKRLHIPLVITGGSGDPSRPQLSEADAMAETAVSLGVPRKGIIIENKSRNTLESAAAMKNILRGRRILLVTSAYHLKRSTAMFKKQGFTVVPAAAGYKAEQQAFSFFSLIPQASSLHVSSIAIHEYVSFIWYNYRGKT